MDPLLLSAFFFFAFTATITPGPNNIMMLASGARFGFRRTLPHILGVAFGFPALVLVVGLGLGALLQQSALFHHILRILGAGFMLYLSYLIAFAPVGAEKKQMKKSARFVFMKRCFFNGSMAKPGR